MNRIRTHNFGVLALTLTTIAAAVIAAPSVEARETGYWAKGRILVQTNAGLSDAELGKILSRHGGRSARRLNKIHVHVVDIPLGADEQVAVDLLKRNPHIKSAELDKLVAPDLTGNDAYYANAWHLPKIQAPTAWDTAVGTSVTIAILDSGVDGTHPDLAGKMVGGWNFYDDNSNTSDVYGHGTKVAGAAAASSNNALGVTSVAWNSKIMPIRISDTAGYAFYSTIAEGIYWAADHGAKVANVSYSVQGSASVQSAANYMRSKGGLVVNSAGNTGLLDTTAANGALISVSATGSTDTKASWSSYGDYVDVAAPGVGIWSTTRGGGYAAVSGTSFASPVTAGVIALMMSANSSLQPAELENLLKTTSVDLGTAGRDQQFGAGRINAAAAVQAARSLLKTNDATSPQVLIATPTAGNVSGIVTVNVTATDNIGVTKVELYANNALVATDVAPAYSFSLDTASLANGTVSLLAKAYDAAGNVATSATRSVNVANAATEIILDNAAVGVQDTSGGRTFVGTWCQSSAAGQYGTNSLYSCGSVANSYRWTPQIKIAASYDVYVRWTAHANRSSSVPIAVTHSAGSVTQTFNQKLNGAQWVLLGRYNFSAGIAGHVEVKASNGQACADAVRFTPVPGT